MRKAERDRETQRETEIWEMRETERQTDERDKRDRERDIEGERERASWGFL